MAALKYNDFPQPRAGQAIVIKSQGFIWKARFSVGVVRRSLGWKVQLREPVQGQDTVRIDQIVAVVADLNAGRELIKKMRDLSDERYQRVDDMNAEFSARLHGIFPGRWSQEGRADA